MKFRLRPSSVKERISDAGVDSHVYADLKERVLDRLESTREATSEKVDEAIDYAVSSATQATDFTKEQLAKASERVRQEIRDVSENVTHSGEALRTRLAPSRPRNRYLLLASAAMGIGSFLLGRLSSTPRASDVYRKGDTAGPGLFMCRNCGTRLQLESKTRLPGCSSCHKTEFSKID
jgi:hypothetical protein